MVSNLIRNRVPRKLWDYGACSVRLPKPEGCAATARYRRSEVRLLTSQSISVSVLTMFGTRRMLDWEKRRSVDGSEIRTELADSCPTGY
jgi:hypothetical protein